MRVEAVRSADCAGCADSHDVRLNGVVVGQVYRDEVDLFRVRRDRQGAAPWYGTAYPETDTSPSFGLDGAAAFVVAGYLRGLPVEVARRVRSGQPPTPPRRLTADDLYPDRAA